VLPDLSMTGQIRWAIYGGFAVAGWNGVGRCRPVSAAKLMREGLGEADVSGWIVLSA
jgi:hypothetical protein